MCVTGRLKTEGEPKQVWAADLLVSGSAVFYCASTVNSEVSTGLKDGRSSKDSRHSKKCLISFTRLLCGWIQRKAEELLICSAYTGFLALEDRALRIAVLFISQRWL